MFLLPALGSYLVGCNAVYPSVSQDELSALYKHSSTGLLDNPPARYIDFPLKELQAGLLRPVPKEAASQEELVHYRALLDRHHALQGPVENNAGQLGLN